MRGPGGACGCWRGPADAPGADARSHRSGRWVARGALRAAAAAAARGTAASVGGSHTRRRGRRACRARVAGRGPVPIRSCADVARPARPSSRCCVAVVRDHVGHSAPPAGSTASTCCAVMSVSTIVVVWPGLASCTVTPTTAPDSRAENCDAEPRGASTNVEGDNAAERCGASKPSGTDTETRKPGKAAGAGPHYRPRNQQIALSTERWSTRKWRAIAATGTPRACIPAASAAIRWYTGVFDGARTSTCTRSTATVRNLCVRVHPSRCTPRE